MEAGHNDGVASFNYAEPLCAEEVGGSAIKFNPMVSMVATIQEVSLPCIARFTSMLWSRLEPAISVGFARSGPSFTPHQLVVALE